MCRSMGTLRFEFVHPNQYLVAGFKTKGKHMHTEQKSQETEIQADVFQVTANDYKSMLPCNSTKARSVGAKRSVQDLFQKHLRIFVFLQYSLHFCLPGIYHRLHLGKRKRKRVIQKPVSLPLVLRTNLAIPLQGLHSAQHKASSKSQRWCFP